jgi:hypothetical protein
MKREMIYSWGEFYDTVSTCDEYTDEQRKQFLVFEALDKTATLKEIRKVLKQYKLSEIEINRLNSPCLDGLLVSVKYKKPLQKIIKSFPRDERYLETCKYYLEKSISKRCLFMASKYGREKIVELLLNRGADIHAENDWALHTASRNGHTEVVRLLLDRGADIHANNDWALRWASRYGHTETVKLLLDRGAENDLALRSASKNDHTDTKIIIYEKITINNTNNLFAFL